MQKLQSLKEHSSMDYDFSFPCLTQSQQDNTMGKQLAEERTSTIRMQREMAIRRTIEELQLQQYVDCGDEIMPVQVQFPRPNQTSSPRPSPNPSSRPNVSFGQISKRRQLASSSQSPPLQHLEVEVFKDYSLNHFCDICQVPCSGSLNYKQHINGKRHKLKVQELKFGREDDGEADTSASTMENQKPWCKLCDVWCTDDNLLKQHLAGKKHKKRQAKLSHDSTVNWCKLCGIGCTSKELLESHYNGKKHKEAELKKLECAQKGGEDAQNRPWRCKLCQAWCPDKKSLLMHLKEKNHFLNELEVKKRKWQDSIRGLGN